jgi:hypothetical protein
MMEQNFSNSLQHNNTQPPQPQLSLRQEAHRLLDLLPDEIITHALDDIIEMCEFYLTLDQQIEGEIDRALKNLEPLPTHPASPQPNVAKRLLERIKEITIR